MIVLGIDPGIARMGFGVIEEIKLKARAVDYGCVETKKNIPHAERLVILHKEITRLIQKYKPFVYSRHLLL